MEEILNNLEVGQILYTTSKQTNYRFIKRDENGGIVYSINNSLKTLPLTTILAGQRDFLNGIDINKNWYRNYNNEEASSRPCNLSVLRNLLSWLEED